MYSNNQFLVKRMLLFNHDIMNYRENVDILICIKFDTNFITSTHVIERFHKIQSTLKAQHDMERTTCTKVKTFFYISVVGWSHGTLEVHTHIKCVYR